MAIVVPSSALCMRVTMLCARVPRRRHGAPPGERAGFRVEDDLPRALAKDGGVDPKALAWLLVDFPVRPLPQMLLPLTEPELLAFRDELRDRMKRLSLPDGRDRA